jgi:hypothetical protein
MLSIMLGINYIRMENNMERVDNSGIRPTYHYNARINNKEQNGE